MESNNLIIGALLIIILILVLAIGYVLLSNQNEDVNTIVNDTNSTYSVTDNVANATMQEDNSPKHYDDWQKDYETGEYDEYGSPIYRSVISTSGGQNETGIYEAYWSENGPISEKRIG